MRFTAIRPMQVETRLPVAKKPRHEWETDGQRQLPVELARTLTKINFMALLEHTRKTKGSPQSEQRRQQIAKFPDLRIEQFHILANQHGWMDFILDQPEGYWIAVCLASLETRDSDCSRSTFMAAERRSIDGLG